MNKCTLRQTPLAVAIGTLLAGSAVEAATITVDTNADLGAFSQCSLRSAIASANTDTVVDGCAAGDGADEIVFDGSLAQSTITGPVPGDAAGLVINGNQQSRIFRTVDDLGLDSPALTGGRTSTSFARGSAIYALYANLSLAHVMVTGNSTTGNSVGGGGLYVYDGNVTLTNSTVSGNSTTGNNANGGGLSLSGAAATLTHSTVAHNAVDGTDGVHSGALSTLTFNNSLIVQAGAGETACNQTASSHTNSLITDTTCTGTATDVADIALGSLADNGGLTQTHAPDADSVAVNGAGDCQDEFGVTEDQRGESRPGLGSAACDIGAYEFQPLELVPAALDFGAVRVAATAGPLTMTVSSNPDSTDNLEITGVGPITGPGAAAFTISADACTGMTLPPGESCDVGIEFTPDDRMQFDAQVGFQFASESAEAALTGTGIAPVMGLLPQTLDFGSVAVDETGGPLSLTVSNNGDDLLQVNGLLGLGAPFSLTSGGDCGAIPFTLAAGEDCVLDFVFAPTGQGEALQPVMVDSDSFGGDQAFNLQDLGFSIDDEIFEDRFEP